MTKLSIFTPAHITNDFFKWCILSVTNQSYRNWEWIILDNSPNYGIENFLRNVLWENFTPLEIIELNKKIKVYKDVTGSKNIGQLKDIAARLCTGELLIEQDCDDVMMSFALASFAQATKHIERAQFFFSDYIPVKVFYNEKDEMGFLNMNNGHLHLDNCTVEFHKLYGKNLNLNVNVFGSQAITKDFILTNQIVPCNLRAWRREFFNQIGGFNPEVKLWEDYDIVLRSYLEIFKNPENISNSRICRISHPCYLYFLHDKNSTNEEVSNKLRSEIVESFRPQIENLFERIKEEIGIETLPIHRFIPTHPPEAKNFTLLS